MPELQKQGGVGVAVEPLRHGMLTSAVNCSSKLCISASVFDSCTLSAVGSVSSVLPWLSFMLPAGTHASRRRHDANLQRR